MHDTAENERIKLNAETAKANWSELERHYARGVMIKVARDLDLVEVATAMARDDKDAFTRWMNAGHVARPSDADALSWHEHNATLWAVVVAPWVLVQEVS